MSNVNEMNEMNEMNVADQAATIAAGMINVAMEAGSEHEQVFIASSGLDAMEASVREATKKYMKEKHQLGQFMILIMKQL